MPDSGAHAGGQGSSFEVALSKSAATLRRPLVVGAFAAFVLFVTVALVVVWRQYEDAKDTAAHELRARAVLAATVFDTYFQGELQTLSAIAASPAVVSGDADAMSGYFARFRPGSGTPFTAGVGWIDPTGHQRATSDPNGPVPYDLAQRSYFKEALGTGKPVVADAIVALGSKRRLLVMAVPTRSTRGHVTGVLAGGIVLRPSAANARANDLGYEGLHVIDASGQQVTRRDLGHPSNGDLVSRLRSSGEGVLVDVDGLDGSSGRVVAFGTARVPQWTTVLDQPASLVFADARRSLIREVLLVCVASALVLGFFAWAMWRSGRHLAGGRAQVARWAQLTRDLNDASDVDDVEAVFLRTLAAEYPDGVVTIVRVEEGSGDVAPADTDATARGREGVVAAVAALAGRERTPAVLATTDDVRTLSGGSAAGVRSAYGVSLRDREAARVAVVVFAREHALDAIELALLGAYADQVEQALARVRRHELEHDAAVQLQQSLLPDRLPETPGVVVAAHYRAGAPNTKVGGDWYDVVRRDDGIVHMTVGDVAGRGIDAAISMGQLRNAFRAYALEHVSPAAIVDRLERHVPDNEMATTVCVTYDPCTRELNYASAGHPPALLIDGEGGHVVRLDESRRVPLGWPSSTPTRDQRIVLPTNATLALYTDGLVEHRAMAIDDGIDRLAEALASAVSASADGVDAIVAAAAPNPDDDVALLVVTFVAAPARLGIEIPADRREIRGLRRRVHAWLSQLGVEETTQQAAVLALNEACANAIEHGYRDADGGTISIDLTRSGGALAIVVEDRGTWREPSYDPDRGRGIFLMQNLMEKAEIQRRRQGTRVVLELPV